MCSKELKNIPISTSFLHDLEYKFLMTTKRPREMRRANSERNQSVEKITNLLNLKSYRDTKPEMIRSLFTKLVDLPVANIQRARLATVV